MASRCLNKYPTRFLVLPLSLALFLAGSAGTAALGKARTTPRPRAGAAERQPAAGSRAGSPAGAGAAVYNAYLDRLRTKVLDNWMIPDGKNRVVLSATVSIDGSVSAISISSTPSNAMAEQAASDALNHAQPLETLPSAAGSARLTATFDSTSDPHGDFHSSLRLRMDPAGGKPVTLPAPAGRDAK